MTNVQKLLTAEQVAELLGVTTHTLAVWRSTGRYNLPYVKSGRLVRYRESDEPFVETLQRIGLEPFKERVYPKALEALA